MSNPKPSLLQCMILHQIHDGEVRHDPASDIWWAMGSHREHKVNMQIKKLWRDSYIRILVDSVDSPQRVELTQDGLDVIKRRPLHELLEAMNRR